jgi:hypothetical protein
MSGFMSVEGHLLPKNSVLDCWEWSRGHNQKRQMQAHYVFLDLFAADFTDLR